MRTRPRRAPDRRSRRRPALLTAAAAAAGLALLSPSAARATLRDWQGGTAAWNVGSNWNPAGQPMNGDVAYIHQDNAIVTYANTAFPAAVLDDFQIDAASVATLVQSKDTLTILNEIIGNSKFGAVQQSGGVHAVTGGNGLALGSDPAGNGAYALSGSGVLNVTGYEAVAVSGTAVFTQTGGTHTVSGTGILNIAESPTSNGTYNLSGGTLHTASTTISLGGTAVFNHTGGTHKVDDIIEMGDGSNAGASAKYTLSGTGQINAKRLYIGGINKSQFVQTGGAVILTEDLRTGNSGGGDGTYALSGGTVSTVDMTVGNSGTGVFTTTGGTLAVSGGLNVGLFAGGVGTFNASNGASVTVNHAALGVFATGTLNVSPGGAFAVTQYLSVAVNDPNASAIVNLSGGTLSAHDLSLGTGGTGLVNHTGGTMAVGGTLTIGAKGAYLMSGGAFAPAAVDLGPGSKFKLTGGKFKPAGLNFVGGGGKLDATNQSFVIDYVGPTPIIAVRTAATSGYKVGAWDGVGLQSSTAAGDATKKTAVGYGEAGKLLGLTGNQTATWQGQTVDATSVLVRYTLYGDADLDGKVGFPDLVKVAQNYGAPGAFTWADGDFNFDGTVGFPDLVKVAQNYDLSLPAAPIPGASATFERDIATAFASVPEPTSLGSLAMLVACQLTRRRRQRATPAPTTR